MQYPRLNLYEINTATWLYKLTQNYRQAISLANVPSGEWNRIASFGFNAVWLMGVWERSPAAASLTRADIGFTRYLKRILPNFNADQDIIGSPYAIRSYTADARFGGTEGLAIARSELKKRGISLILDYVPNHTAPDHEWVAAHPEYFIHGSPEDMRTNPPAYKQIGAQIFATGHNPEVYPWTDVLQLNAFSHGLRQESKELIASLTTQCDGLRCDAAMLMLNNVFQYTWQAQADRPPVNEFWSELINTAHSTSPDFIFIAETYWHTEQQLLDLGFAYCFDKNDFYDSVVEDKVDNIFHMLFQQADHQRRMVRGLENHDERRAATALSLDKHKLAEILVATTPGSSMHYEGQFDGTKQQVPVSLRREPVHKPDTKISDYYDRLFALTQNITHNLIDWQQCNVTTVKRQHLSSVLAWTWQSTNMEQYLVLINWNKRKRHIIVQPPWHTARLSAHDFNCIFTTKKPPKMQPTIEGVDCILEPYQGLILKITGQT